eukprot:scaffold27497_cov131-Isochrysis_galbana.AAC.1
MAGGWHMAHAQADGIRHVAHYHYVHMRNVRNARNTYDARETYKRAIRRCVVCESCMIHTHMTCVCVFHARTPTHARAYYIFRVAHSTWHLITPLPLLHCAM